MSEAFKFFDSWGRIVEVSVSAALFFVFIVAMVRVLGSRTTGQLNNFDWIIMVAVGSLAASGILLDDVAVLDGLTAILVLAICQYLTSSLTRRSERIARIVKTQPTLLMHRGEFMRDAMDRCRVSEAEIRTALRGEGLTRSDDVAWVVLENDGTISVLSEHQGPIDTMDVLEDVENREAVEG